VILAVFGTAAVAVGLSAAATSSGGDSAPAREQAARPEPTKATSTMNKSARRAKANDADPATATRSNRSQSVEEIEQYWTQERMDSAQPMGKTRTGAKPSSPPAPSGNTVEGSQPTGSTPAKKPSTKKSQQTTETRVASNPTTNDPGYWTDEQLGEAEPMEKTRPRGGGSRGSPGFSPGSSAPGSPPP
jgi:hypothetical protein